MSKDFGYQFFINSRLSDKFVYGTSILSWNVYYKRFVNRILVGYGIQELLRVSRFELFENIQIIQHLLYILIRSSQSLILKPLLVGASRAWPTSDFFESNFDLNKMQMGLFQNTLLVPFLKKWVPGYFGNSLIITQIENIHPRSGYHQQKLETRLEGVRYQQPRREGSYDPFYRARTAVFYKNFTRFDVVIFFGTSEINSKAVKEVVSRGFCTIGISNSNSDAKDIMFNIKMNDNSPELAKRFLLLIMQAMKRGWQHQNVKEQDLFRYSDRDRKRNVDWKWCVFHMKLAMNCRYFKKQLRWREWLLLRRLNLNLYRVQKFLGHFKRRYWKRHWIPRWRKHWHLRFFKYWKTKRHRVLCNLSFLRYRIRRTRKSRRFIIRKRYNFTQISKRVRTTSHGFEKFKYLFKSDQTRWMWWRNPGDRKAIWQRKRFQVQSVTSRFFMIRRPFRYEKAKVRRLLQTPAYRLSRQLKVLNVFRRVFIIPPIERLFFNTIIPCFEFFENGIRIYSLWQRFVVILVEQYQFQLINYIFFSHLCLLVKSLKFVLVVNLKTDLIRLKYFKLSLLIRMSAESV